MQPPAGRVGAVGDYAAERVAQDITDIVLVCDKVNHRNKAVLVRKQIECKFICVAARLRGKLGNGLSDIVRVCTACKRGYTHVFPSNQTDNIFKVRAGFHPLAQLRTECGLSQIFTQCIKAAALALGRQHVNQLRRTGLIRIKVAREVSPILARLRHHLKHLRHGSAPVFATHTLKVADVHRRAQRARHVDHLGKRRNDTRALLTHMDGDNRTAFAQRRKCLNQAVGRIKALRRIAKTERQTDCAACKRRFKLRLNLAHLLCAQPVCTIACDAGADCAKPRQHSHIQRKRRLRRRVKITLHGGRINRRVHLPGDGSEIVIDLLPPRFRRGRNGQTAVAVDNRRQPLRQLQPAKARTEHRRVGVAVNIPEAGRDVASRRVNACPGLRAGQPAHSLDLPVQNGDVAGKRLAAQTVNQRAAGDNRIKNHCVASFPME